MDDACRRRLGGTDAREGNEEKDMGTRMKIGALGLVAALAATAAPALAGGFTAADIQFLYGADLGDFKEYGGKLFPMFTLELANGWTYGDNFFFTDWNQGPTHEKTKTL